MKVYDNDDEQLQALQSWWADHGKSLIWTIILCFIGLAAWQGWQTHVQYRTHQASLALQNILDAPNPSDQRSAAQALIKQYPSTPYRALAGLILARNAFDLHDLDHAQAALQGVIDQRTPPVFSQIARLRLAHLLIDRDQAAQALGILAQIDDPAFGVQIARTKGDAHRAMKSDAMAIESYQEALQMALKDPDQQAQVMPLQILISQIQAHL